MLFSRGIVSCLHSAENELQHKNFGIFVKSTGFKQNHIVNLTYVNYKLNDSLTWQQFGRIFP